MEALAELIAEQQNYIGQLQAQIAALELEKSDLAEIAEKADARAEELQEQFDALRPTEKTYLDLRRYIREDKALITKLEAKAEQLDEAVKECDKYRDRDAEKQETLDLVSDSIANFCQDMGFGSYPEKIPFEPIQAIVEELEKYTYDEETNAD